MPTPPIADVERGPQAPARRPRGAAAAIALAAAATVGAAALLGYWLGDRAVVIRTAVLAAAGGIVLLRLAERRPPGATFGAANSVTLVRAALVVLLAALVGVMPTPSLAWALVGLGAAGAALDGVDGALARRRNEASDFGARFDMETDAALVMVLAILAWQSGSVGPWVLASGLLRYAFVAAGWLRPRLRRPLPPSLRRRSAAAVQMVALVVVLAPGVPRPAANLVAAAALALLCWSFFLDTLWLHQHAEDRRS
jgi:phosphatidylglycerophosphate synthase